VLKIQISLDSGCDVSTARRDRVGCRHRGKITDMPAALKRKMIRLKQIRRGVDATQEVHAALKALGLGEIYKFSEIPDTKEVRKLMAEVGGLISILHGPDILFPREASTLGDERIRDMVEAVRAQIKKDSRKRRAANSKRPAE
jgi:ribosomal protein L30/L7E